MVFGQASFSKDVAPVVFSKCAQCNHPGGSAPFSLLTYRDARPHATQMALLTKNRVMPPWTAAVHFNYGTALAASNRFNEAIMQYRRAQVLRLYVGLTFRSAGEPPTYRCQRVG